MIITPPVVVAASCQYPNKDATVLTPVAPKLSESHGKHATVSRTAIVEVAVAPNGSVQHVTIMQSSGDATIDKAALEAAKESTYSPATRNCAGVTGKYLFKVQVAP